MKPEPKIANPLKDVSEGADEIYRFLENLTNKKEGSGNPLRELRNEVEENGKPLEVGELKIKNYSLSGSNSTSISYKHSLTLQVNSCSAWIITRGCCPYEVNCKPVFRDNSEAGEPTIYSRKKLGTTKIRDIMDELQELNDYCHEGPEL